MDNTQRNNPQKENIVSDAVTYHVDDKHIATVTLNLSLIHI